jgi:RNA polymerase sigma factor (sigma-70 family)
MPSGCHAGRRFGVTVTDTEEEGNVTVVHGERGADAAAGGGGTGREPDAWLAERFQEQRGRLRALAYRMLGSLEEADDAVQEAWLRCSAAGTDDVLNLGGWLTTIVGRVCLNALRARAARPETLAGPRIPDPVLSPEDGPTPEQEALLAESVGLALLVVLDTLAPVERVAFVLHDVFDVPFAEIGRHQAGCQPRTPPRPRGRRDRTGRHGRRSASGSRCVLRRRPHWRPDDAGGAA